MTILQALREGAVLLEQAGVPDSRLDAELLLAHVLHANRLDLVLRGRDALPGDDAAAYAALLARRETREPLQYILGRQSFMGFDLHVNESVLIPRPETELLCEHALAWLEKSGLCSPTVLDLCTGSGAIAIAIKKIFPGALVTGCDISEKALKVAKENARLLGAQITFLQGDFLAAASGMKFDMIACNPPYIPSASCEALQAEVMREPHNALDGGEDGLTFYRRLALNAPAFLYSGGAVFCEVGYDQGEAVQSLFAPRFLQTGIFSDLRGIPRMVYAAHLKSLPGGTHVR